MKEQINDFFKGIVIGVANVIPGLSGGTIAIVFNIYNKLVNALKNLLSHPFKTIKEIWGLLLGVLVGVVISVYVVVELVEKFPIPTTMLFVGLIIGSIPRIYQNIKNQKKSVIDYIIFVCFIIMLIVLPFLPGKELDITISVKTIIIIFFIGLITASTMVIPGISGSMILMAIGYYLFIWGTVNNFITSLLNLNFEDVIIYLIPLIPFAIGILCGVVFISKLISRLLIKYGRSVYCAILGLLIASPFVIIYSMIDEYGEKMQKDLIINIAFGIIMLIIGSFCSLYMSFMHSKEEDYIKK